MPKKPTYEELEQRIKELEKAKSERKQAEARHQELHQLVHSLPIPTALFDPNGDVLTINDALTALLGYTIEDVPLVEAHWALFYPDPVYRCIP